MPTSAARRNGRTAKARTKEKAGPASRKAANSPALRYLARAGLAARGALYVIIGWIAIQVAFGHAGDEADQAGALRMLGRSPAGEIALWLLVIGFAGMCLWRLSEAIFGAAGPDGGKATARLSSLVKALIYGFIAFGVLKYALSVGGPKSSDQQSVDLTATAMSHPGGRAAVVAAGVVLAITGLVMAFSAWHKLFFKKLDTAQLGPYAQTIVGWLGRVGGIARGAVFVIAGVFLIIAAVDARPQQAKGIDSALRALARTPLGPWLLLIVAIGLIMFGAFSCCEARWRRVQPGD